MQPTKQIKAISAMASAGITSTVKLTYLLALEQVGPKGARDLAQFLGLSIDNAYNHLSQLEKSKFLRMVAEDRAHAGGRSSKVYDLTPNGRKVVQAFSSLGRSEG